MLKTLHTPANTSPMATLILVLALLQGSSFLLTAAMRSPFASDFAVSMMTALWLLMYFVAALGLLSSSGLNWGVWMVRYRLPLTLLVAGSCFSALWSIDSMLTLARSVHLLGTTLVAVYIGLTLPLVNILRTSAAVLGLIMVASITVAALLPSWGLVEYENTIVWAGVLTSKNTLGFWSAVTLFLLVSICFWRISTEARAFYLLLAFASAVCLLFAESATSLLALFAASLVMVSMYVARRLQLKPISVIILGILLTGLIAVAMHFVDTAALIGRSGDLTGRAEVWAQTWQLILDKPWTGYGYGTLWFPTDSSIWIQETLTNFTWTVHHAHNGFLHIASEIGLPLTMLALVMIIQQVVEILYCQYQRQQPGVLFVLGYMVALLLSNYSEARLLINRDLYWIFFIALPISMLQQATVRQALPAVFGFPALVPSYNREKLKAARKKLQHRRFLKQRLSKRRVITVVNTTDIDTAATAANTHETEPTAFYAAKKSDGQLTQVDHQRIIQHKMARRQRKADRGNLH